MKKNLRYYLQQRYAITIRPLSEAEGGGYFAEIPQLGTCWGDGSTPDAALKKLMQCKKLWFEAALEEGIKIPESKTHRKSISSLKKPVPV